MHGLRASIGLALCVICVAGLSAQEQRGSLEVTASSQPVSANFGDWRDITARARLRAGSRAHLVIDGSTVSAFDGHATYGGVGLLVDLNPRWTVYVAGGGSTGEPILAKGRADAQIGVGLVRNIRLNFGGGISRGTGPYRDQNGFASLAAYFPHGVVLEGGGRLSTSNPGSVHTSRGFGAFNWTSPRGRALVIAGSSGGEGWQLLSEDRALVQFSSTELSATFRQPITAALGVVARYTRYTNRFYTRQGPSLGVALHW